MIDVFEGYIDLAAERLGGQVLFATDDFFAEKENLIKPGRGVFIADKFTEHGKWMDGWESRRKRVPGFDWCVIKLAVPGQIHAFDIDTNHFLGNHPPFASVEAVKLDSTRPVEDSDWDTLSWEEVLGRSPLDPGSQHKFHCHVQKVFTHVRLNIYPDGGVARFRVFGQIHKDWSQVDDNEEIDLASMTNGAQAMKCSDMFFSNMSNLILPGTGVNMGDGWETKRSRTSGHNDWVIIKLAHPGYIDRMVVDTAHFKGNYPESCVLYGCQALDGKVPLDESAWSPLTDRVPLSAHQVQHTKCVRSDWVSHVRFTIYPDGGVSRLRLPGKIARV